MKYTTLDENLNIITAKINGYDYIRLVFGVFPYWYVYDNDDKSWEALNMIYCRELESLYQENK